MQLMTHQTQQHDLSHMQTTYEQHSIQDSWQLHKTLQNIENNSYQKEIQ